MFQIGRAPNQEHKEHQLRQHQRNAKESQELSGGTKFQILITKSNEAVDIFAALLAAREKQMILAKGDSADNVIAFGEALQPLRAMLRQRSTTKDLHPSLLFPMAPPPKFNKGLAMLLWGVGLFS